MPAHVSAPDVHDWGGGDSMRVSRADDRSPRCCSDGSGVRPWPWVATDLLFIAVTLGLLAVAATGRALSVRWEEPWAQRTALSPRSRSGSWHDYTVLQLVELRLIANASAVERAGSLPPNGDILTAGKFPDTQWAATRWCIGAGVWAAALIVWAGMAACLLKANRGGPWLADHYGDPFYQSPMSLPVCIARYGVVPAAVLAVTQALLTHLLLLAASAELDALCAEVVLEWELFRRTLLASHELKTTPADCSSDWGATSAITITWLAVAVCFVYAVVHAAQDCTVACCSGTKEPVLARIGEAVRVGLGVGDQPQAAEPASPRPGQPIAASPRPSPESDCPERMTLLVVGKGQRIELRVGDPVSYRADDGSWRAGASIECIYDDLTADVRTFTQKLVRRSRDQIAAAAAQAEPQTTPASPSAAARTARAAAAAVKRVRKAERSQRRQRTQSVERSRSRAEEEQRRQREARHTELRRQLNKNLRSRHAVEGEDELEGVWRRAAASAAKWSSYCGGADDAREDGEESPAAAAAPEAAPVQREELEEEEEGADEDFDDEAGDSEYDPFAVAPQTGLTPRSRLLVAEELSAIGFTVDLCELALVESGDRREEAVALLLEHADQLMSVQRAQHRRSSLAIDEACLPVQVAPPDDDGDRASGAASDARPSPHSTNGGNAPPDSIAALRFEGGFVSLGSPAALSFVVPVSVDCFIRFRTVAEGVTQTLLWRLPTDTTPGLLWQLRGDRLCVGWTDSVDTDQAVLTASVRLQPSSKGRWVHVAAVWNSQWFVYADGRAGESVPSDCNVQGRVDVAEWFIGCCPDSSSPAPMRADLRDFRIWRAALTPKRVSELARGASAGASDVLLVCCLRCTEGEGRAVVDSGGTAWAETGRMHGELRGRVGWVGRDRPGARAGAVEAEPDLTTLDDGDDDASYPSQPAAHCCVDRQLLADQLRELPTLDKVLRLCAAHQLVARIYARAIVVEALAEWPDDTPLLAGTLGGAAALCGLLRSLVDSSEPTAAAVVKGRLRRVMADSEESERGALLSLLLDNALSFLSESPQSTVRDSPHPYVAAAGVTRCVSVPGHTRYRVLFDTRCAHDTFTITADDEGKRVIARYGPGRAAPWPPVEVNLPQFYFTYKSEGPPAVPSWGYKYTVEFGYERFELGLELLEAVVNFCGCTPSCPLPRPAHVFNAVLGAIGHSTSIHRRQLFSVLRQTVSSPDQWAARQRPRLADLTPLRLGLEQQYKHEVMSGACVMHSKFVQSLTELFLAVKDAEVVWAQAAPSHSSAERTAPELPQGKHCSKGRYGKEYRVGADRVSMVAPDGSSDTVKIDTDESDRTIAVWSESSQRCTFVASVALLRGRWYFEVRQLTPGAFTIGLLSSRCPRDALVGEQPGTWGWDARGCTAVLEGDSVPFPSDRQLRMQLKDVVGVAVDLTTPDDCSMHLTLNGMSLGCACRFSLQPGESVHPALTLSANEGAILNFGASYFEHELPHGGYIPPEVSNLALGNVLPFDQIRAFIDLAHCFLHARPLPPFFHDPTDHFKAEAEAGDRVGPPFVELVTDGTGVITNGLECRNTGTAFYSVKGNVRVVRGKWYYEIELAAHGLMQVGWVTDRFVSKPVAGVGVGDDAHSWGLDLFRRLRWHRNQPQAVSTQKWAAGDIVGVAIDLPGDGRGGTITYRLNGEVVLTGDGSPLIFEHVRAGDGVYPAATFRANNGGVFNFGDSNLQYMPEGYRALGVPDSWLERIDLFYTCADADWIRERQRLAQVPIDRSRQRAEGTGADWDLTKDEALVSLVSALCRAQKKNLHQVSLERGRFEEVWQRHPALQGVPTDELRERAGILNKFNRLVYNLIPLISFEKPAPGTLSAAGLLMQVRGLLYQSVADDIVKGVVKTTNGCGEPIRMVLNRRKAARHRQFPEEDPSGRWSLFGQTTELLGNQPPQVFKTAHRFWSVVFTGEGAEDVGGPFREHITEMCAELMSNATPFFIPSPNQRSSSGTHCDCFVPRPSACTDVHLRQYEFLGRLMGGALRSNEPLSLYLPPLVWKGIAGHPLEVSDLESVDQLCLQCIKNFGTLSDQGVTEDMFNRTFHTETFSTQLSDGTTVELFPGGASELVTFERRLEYVDLVGKVRLHESERQIQAMRRGLCSVIPKHILYLLTWNELELKVCGKADFTVKDLKEWTTFDGISKDDRRVAYLWQVLSEITASDRRAFLRFVSGRERLPVKLRVMPLYCTGDPDQYLPKAATCFFALELPEYSSVEVTRMKLLYAIQHCSDIDTDFRAREFDEDQAPLLGIDDSGRPPHSDEDYELGGGSEGSGQSGDDWGDEI
eukprot:TRINITY_DN5535_c0_g3_i1.p1 TRINITY_DN5535_c0_g3~~TRINITY_DN5535_c0_g3_i1.p1  ORF type:complete len:2316 (+),score=648.89 TRINITY_DN5535_c0_g3_i1:54-7001(+)